MVTSKPINGWKIILLLLLAIMVGLGVGVARIAAMRQSPAFTQYGSWRGTGNLITSKDDLLTTQVTIFALFALPNTEAVYLFAATDENDNRLNGNNTYTIQGNINNIKAQYWSITAYGMDLFLIPNKANRFGFNAGNIQTDSTGNFKIALSANQVPGNWLPVVKDKKFGLVLRLYKGDNEFMEHLDQAQLPVIKLLK